jgi:uroporphyrinogen decarboxylase
MDAYNPVQYNSRGMDCETLKKRFGDRVTFWGGIDTSRILPRGTTKEVKEEVHKTIKIFAPNGGYVLNPVHNIQPDVPAENVCEMFDSAMIYGRKGNYIGVAEHKDTPDV